MQPCSFLWRRVTESTNKRNSDGKQYFKVSSIPPSTPLLHWGQWDWKHKHKKYAVWNSLRFDSASLNLDSSKHCFFSIVDVYYIQFSSKIYNSINSSSIKISFLYLWVFVVAHSTKTNRRIYIQSSETLFFSFSCDTLQLLQFLETKWELTDLSTHHALRNGHILSFYLTVFLYIIYVVYILPLPRSHPLRFSLHPRFLGSIALWLPRSQSLPFVVPNHSTSLSNQQNLQSITSYRSFHCPYGCICSSEREHPVPGGYCGIRHFQVARRNFLGEDSLFRRHIHQHTPDTEYSSTNGRTHLRLPERFHQLQHNSLWYFTIQLLVRVVHIVLHVIPFISFEFKFH